MTNEEILQLARDCRIVGKNHTGTGDYMDKFIAFANAVRNAALTEAAEICVASKLIEWATTVEIMAINKCAAAIREARNG